MRVNFNLNNFLREQKRAIVFVAVFVALRTSAHSGFSPGQLRGSVTPIITFPGLGIPANRPCRAKRGSARLKPDDGERHQGVVHLQRTLPIKQVPSDDSRFVRKFMGEHGRECIDVGTFHGYVLTYDCKISLPFNLPYTAECHEVLPAGIDLAFRDGRSKSGIEVDAGCLLNLQLDVGADLRLKAGHLRPHVVDSRQERRKGVIARVIGGNSARQVRLRIGDPDCGAHQHGAARVRDDTGDFTKRLADSRRRQGDRQRKRFGRIS